MLKSCNLIFEGPDRCGKTTTLEAFRDLYPEFHLRKAEKNVDLFDSVRYYNSWFTRLQLNTHPMIWDRGHISEQVYVELYRQQNKIMGWPDYLHLAEFIPTTQPTYIVYMRPSHLEFIKEDEENPNRDLRWELSIFDRICFSSNFPCIVIDPTTVHGFRSSIARAQEIEQHILTLQHGRNTTQRWS